MLKKTLVKTIKNRFLVYPTVFKVSRYKKFTSTECFPEKNTKAIIFKWLFDFPIQVSDSNDHPVYVYIIKKN